MSTSKRKIGEESEKLQKKRLKTCRKGGHGDVPLNNSDNKLRTNEQHKRDIKAKRKKNEEKVPGNEKREWPGEQRERSHTHTHKRKTENTFCVHPQRAVARTAADK